MLGGKKPRKRRALSLLTVLMVLVTTVLPMEVFAAGENPYTASEWKAFAKEGYTYKYLGATSGYDGYYVSYNTDSDTTPEEIGWSSMIDIKETDANGEELRNAPVEKVYCCDLLISTQENARYNKTVLENAAYFDPSDPERNKEIAKRLRNVMLHGYPYYSAKELTSSVKAWLAEDSSRGSLSLGWNSKELSTKALVTGTQMAIWSLANSANAPIAYYSDNGNTSWSDSSYISRTSSRKNYSSSNEKNANAVRDYLLAMSMEGQEATPDTVAVGDVDVTAEIIEKPASEGGGFVLSGNFRFYSYDPEDPNGPANNMDNGEIIAERLVAKPVSPDNEDIKMNIVVKNSDGSENSLYSGNLNQMVRQGTLIKLDEETLTYTYNIPLDIDRATAIAYSTSAEVSIGFEGNQQMPRNVYFYQTPLNNTASQNLIGVSEWVNKIDVSANAPVSLELTGTVIGEDTGFTDIPFSNGYTGYCIDRDKHGIDVTGEVKFIEMDSSEATSNVGNNQNISQKLKILFTQGFDKIFVPDGNGSYVVDENIADSTLPAVIYHYTENQHIWGEQKTLTDLVTNYDGPEIPDDGYSIVLENGDTVTFHFKVLSPVSGNNAANTQEFFAFKIDVEKAPVIITQDLSVQKIWEDNNDQDGIRPDSVKVQLKADGVESGEPVTLDAGNNWTYIWADLPESVDGKNIVYTVQEAGVPEGYTSAVAGSEEDGFVIVNSYTPAKTSVSVVKEWNDSNDQDGIRPASVDVKLLANGEVVGEAITLSPDNNWTYTWTNLAKNSNGKAIEYTIEEVEVPSGYEVKITGSAAEGFVITNTHEVALTSIAVIKVWNDKNDQDGIRPEKIAVQLYADGEAQGRAITLSAENSWEYTWADLDKNKAGKAVVYTVGEVVVPEGYTSEITGDAAEGYTITNSYTPEVTSVDVTKVWNDKNDRDGIRPDSVKVQLLANGEAKGDVVTLSAENEWSYTWTNLAKNSEGEAVVYTVKESEVPEDYTSEITGSAVEGFVITNSYAPEQTSVSVVKEWEDNNDQDGLRPDSVEVQLLADGNAKGEAVTLSEANSWTYTWTNLAKKENGKDIAYTLEEISTPEGYTADITGSAAEGFVITNTHTPAVTAVKVAKAWDDNNDQDGIRPGSVAVQLKADGRNYGEPVTLSEANNWAYTWEDLAKLSEGIAINYRVVEQTVLEGYTAEITGSMEEGFVITNTHIPADTKMSVAKVWDDANNQDGIRPSEIKVQLFANGEAEGDAVTLSAENNWEYTWADLDKKANGKAITYTVDETAVPEGYTKEVSKSGNNVVIINSHTPAVTNIKVNKVWNDNNDQDGIRPDDVKVQLLANGEAKGDVVTLSAENNWEYTWADLAKKAEGKAVAYTLEEVSAPEGYTSKISGNSSEGYTIINTHTPETIDIEIEKLWEDLNNVEGIRSEEVKITLKADGEEVGSVPVSDINEWNDEWNDLPKYDNGKEIGYSITVEGVPEEYVTEDTIVSKTEDGKIKFTVKSKYQPKTSVDVKKVWEDAKDQDGLRPEGVQVQLFADGEAYGDPINLTAESGWTYTWENLIKYSDGNAQAKLVEYTVEEVSIPGGYESKLAGDAEAGYVITNAHAPAVVSIDVTKVWNDADNQDGLRPDSIKVQLNADGKAKGKEITLSADNNWTYTWKDLAKFEAGEEIVYTITEVEVPEGYRSSITGDAEEGFTVTNTYAPEVTEITVEKVWDDNNDQDGLRPAAIEVQLTANKADHGRTVVLSADNDWTYTWEDLAKFEAGEEIDYAVEEVGKIEGYETKITGNAKAGYTITNTHTPAVTEVVVEKVWEDADDQDGLRPDSIKIQLLANDKPVESVKLNTANDWSYVWEDLAKFEAGEEIIYTVEEADVPADYISVVTGTVDEGFAITNTHEPAVAEITVEKIWEDADDQDGIRPESIEVQLFADDEEYGKAVTLSAANDWTYTWEDLDKNRDGKEITYAVAETEIPEGYKCDIEVDAEGVFTITNSHVPAVTEVDVEKVWEDAGDQDGLRPDFVQVQLLANGQTSGRAVTLDENNDWAYAWEDLAKFEAGEEIKYTVAEISKIEGYETKITGDAKVGYTITNTHNPAVTEVAVEKVWVDADDQDGLRPDSIEIQLYANDKPSGEPVVISEDDSWAYTWEDLAKYEAGEAVDYTIAEAKVPDGYTSTVSGNEEEGYTITNTHAPEMIKMFVFKQWKDNSNQEGIRPENVEIQLYGDKEKIGKPLDLSDNNEWNDKWSELPKNEDGEEVDYTIDVNGVPDEYSTDVTETTKNDDDGFIVVSEYEPPVEISVQKVWDDEDDKDKIRTRNVKVQLYADGEAVGDPVKIDASKDWKYTWTELEKYDETEKHIEYTVDEVEVPEGYTKTISGNAEEGFTITNTHVVKAAALDDSTDTGDDSCMLLWAMMLLTSLAIMVLILVMGRRRNSQQA